MTTLLNTALAYHASGLCVLPARLAEKRPAIPSWKTYQKRRPTESEVRAWFSNPHDALCLVCGTVANHLEMIDFDHRAELYDAWADRVREQSPALLDKLFVEQSPSGGRHAAYFCESPVCGNMKLAQRCIISSDANPMSIDGKAYKPRKDGDGKFSVIITLIETRGEGGIFLSTPTPGYTAIQGDLRALPTITATERETLLEAAYSLNEFVTQMVDAPAGQVSSRPGDDFNARGDIRPILMRHGWKLVRSGENEHWCRPGKDHGTSATLKDGVLYVFTSNAAPFDQNAAYSPFAAYALLEHNGNYADAASALRTQGYGQELSEAGVDLSGLLHNRSEETVPGVPDPGVVPDHLLRIPGFVSELMDHCLETAPYPNQVMAFCGALSMQAFLAGRKVCDPGDNRTNLYLLGLAHSSSGKDWPRKVNMKLAHRIGLGSGIGNSFASGEGIQDALFVSPSVLFQTDEIDGMLQSINRSLDARHESIMGTLLTMYSSANSVFPMRKKAGKESPGVIDQPCLTVFGTAIPNHYYQALSERMLTNGFFARMLILESAKRGEGQEPSVKEIPTRPLAVAKWWGDFRPGNGNLEHWHPIPSVVEQNDDAKRVLVDARKQAEAEYAKAEQAGDAVGTTVWGRVNEHIRKLSLMYAISTNHEEPRISIAAARWAAEFVMHQTRRMLFMAQGHVAENPFHAECLKLLQKLREAPGHELAHSILMKRLKVDAESFQRLVRTLILQGDIEPCERQTAGRSGVHYRINGGG